MKNILLKLLIAIVLVFVGISVLAGFIINIEWFQDMGYLSVFLTGFKAKCIIFIPSLVIIFGVIHLYTKYLRNNYNKMTNTIEERAKVKTQNRIIAGVSFVVSLMMSIGFTSSYWYQILEFINGSTFNVKDPIFSLDIGFYVFKLPLISNVLSILVTIVVLLIIVTLSFYAILRVKSGVSQVIGIRDLVRGGDNPQIKFVAKQLATFGAMLLLLIAGKFVIRMFNLVYSTRGVVFGAGYTDEHISLLMFKVIAVACVLAAVIIALSIVRKKVMPILITSVLIVVLIVGEGVASGMVEKLIVTPNARAKELPYITRNIEYTRKAFGLDKINSKLFKVDNVLQPKDLTDDKSTVDNIRINEFAQAQEVYNQLQAISNFYKFNDVDIDRYEINGKMQQTFIAARELDSSNREAKFQTWQNKHLFYTHGYGVVMSPTNTVSGSGLPNYILKDIPATGSMVKLTRPQIYFGEINDDYIIVNGKSNEIDYPSGTENQESRYDAKPGLKLNILNRWLLTLNYGEVNFLLSNDIKSDSKILINRNIMNRVQKIAPFIHYDRDPYLVVSEGKLYWIIDGITSTNRYPYSEPYNGVNYIRNSIKVIVDAYDGTVNFYIADKTDAMAQTIGKIYSGLFKDYSTIPADLRKHLRYSEDTMMVQSLVYERYHMTNSNVFYNNEDLWAVAKYKGNDNEDLTVEPVYQVMKLPGESKEKFLLTIPFTVAKKDNMISWLSASVDNGEPTISAITFPKDTSVLGPQQFNSRLKTNTEIKSLMTLLGQKGSIVILGETNIIPIKNSLLYVKPFYLKAEGGKTLPELKKVIVGFGERTVMADNTAQAFQQLFNVNIDNSGTTGTTGTTGTDTTGTTGTTGGTKTAAQLVQTAADLFNKAKDAQKAGDWAGYGNYQKQLEQVINQLQGTVK